MRVLLIGFGFSGLSAAMMLSSCSAKKEAITQHVKLVASEQVSVASNYKSKLTVQFYDDLLIGDWNLPDSNGTDSTEVESNGIKLSFKVKGGKLHYKAQAKPVARSTLETEGNKTETRKKDTAIHADTTIKKSVNRPSGWIKGILLLAVIGVIAAVYHRVKKKLLW